MCAWVTFVLIISNLGKQKGRELAGERRVAFSWTAQCPGASGERRVLGDAPGCCVHARAHTPELEGTEGWDHDASDVG